MALVSAFEQKLYLFWKLKEIQRNKRKFLNLTGDHSIAILSVNTNEIGVRQRKTSIVYSLSQAFIISIPGFFIFESKRKTI